MCWVIKPLCKTLPVIICQHVCAHICHAIHLATKPLLDLLQCVWARHGSGVVYLPSVRGALQSHKEVPAGDAALAEHDRLEREADHVSGPVMGVPLLQLNALLQMQADSIIDVGASTVSLQTCHNMSAMMV